MAYIPSCAEEAAFLKSYDPKKYDSPAVAADTAVFAMDGDALKILLIRRGNYPYKGYWALPGGYIEIDEDIIDSARRELREETGLDGLYLEQVFVWGRPDRDPRSRVITVSYVTLAEMAALEPKAGDDAVQAAWFTLGNWNETDLNGITTVSYTLNGPELLCPRVSYLTGCIQSISPLESGGLAFDHAESICFSYTYLRQRAQNGFIELALKDDASRQHARALLRSHL